MADTQSTTREGFKSLTCCPWDGDNGRRTYSLFALGFDGKVYRLDRAKGCWRPVGSRIMTPTQMKADDKRKYGSGYVEKGYDADLNSGDYDYPTIGRDK